MNLENALAEIYANHVWDFLHSRLLQNASLPLQHVSRGSGGRPSHQVTSNPEPRLVQMVISRGGDEQLHHGTMTSRVMSLVIKVKIGGLAGVIAPLIGKQPPDT